MGWLRARLHEGVRVGGFDDQAMATCLRVPRCRPHRDAPGFQLMTTRIFIVCCLDYRCDGIATQYTLSHVSLHPKHKHTSSPIPTPATRSLPGVLVTCYTTGPGTWD
ncbi:hypothetical protein EJ02DRAFT_69618 [Clathrospora elynae]|uniref:Uncharacterized protein n=1 Tax=Clathrospora elynae TaxID=706981 RepID=A0A6A5SA95_9PLEO|nr:hypothetical protein EJ02DRAFT_69618 [Clathrospora elynae]